MIEEEEIVAAALAWYANLSKTRRYRPYNSATLFALYNACKKLAERADAAGDATSKEKK